MVEPTLSRTSLRWLVLEGFAVVLSILLAFSVDAWWESRQEKHNESVILQSILDDLEEKKSQLEYSVKYNQTILESAKALLDAAASDRSSIDVDEVDHLIGFTWWYNDPSTWDSAPMNSLVVGGELSSISNPILLQQLSELQTSLSGLKNVYENDQNFHSDVLTPFFIANVNLPQIANAIKHAPGHPESAYVFPKFEISTRYDHSDILSRVDFQSLLVAKIDKLVDISNVHVSFDEQIDEAIEIIRGELNN